MEVLHLFFFYGMYLTETELLSTKNKSFISSVRLHPMIHAIVI